MNREAVAQELVKVAKLLAADDKEEALQKGLKEVSALIQALQAKTRGLELKAKAADNKKAVDDLYDAHDQLSAMRRKLEWHTT